MVLFWYSYLKIIGSLKFRIYHVNVPDTLERFDCGHYIAISLRNVFLAETFNRCMESVRQRIKPTDLQIVYLTCSRVDWG